MPKANMFQDPYEGTIGIDKYDENDEYCENIDSKISWAKEWVYVSCWHSSYSESFAMWKIYGMHNESIAITIDSSALEESITKFGISFAQIKHVGYRYVDEYPKPLFEYKPNNRNTILDDDIYSQVFDALFKKHDGYSYEKEIRLVLSQSDVEHDINSEPGIYLPFEKNHIKKITISPMAKEWFHDVVYSIVIRYKLNTKIYSSTLSSE
ncbi:MAG: DUF2971 domain-containing protein [Gammaproteobacteria bacterium]|nr:DUF2971 domain-containing protein [Gammaproteobacteria bacterium]MDH5630729.1 DUF2971 domain-containing protein [Gammaproteobacteria bacterium]